MIHMGSNAYYTMQTNTTTMQTNTNNTETMIQTIEYDDDAFYDLIDFGIASNRGQLRIHKGGHGSL